MMTNIQLYLAIGIPTLAVLIGMVAQLQGIQSLRHEMTARFEGLEKRMDSFEKRMDRFEGALNEMRTTFIKDHTERIVRLEERVYHA